MGHHHHHHNTSDGISQRVNSPRFSGPMARRAHSFKCNNNNDNNNSNRNNNSGTSGGSGNSTTLSTHHEIDVHLSSPRSEMGTNPVSLDGFDSTSLVLERKHHHHVSHRVNIHRSSLQQIREQNIPIVHQINHQIQRPYISKLQQIRHFHLHFCSSSPILTLSNSSGISRRTVTIATSQCGGDGENDIMPEHNLEELPSAFTGYTLLHLSRPLI